MFTPLQSRSRAGGEIRALVLGFDGPIYRSMELAFGTENRTAKCLGDKSPFPQYRQLQHHGVSIQKAPKN